MTKYDDLKKLVIKFPLCTRFKFATRNMNASKNNDLTIPNKILILENQTNKAIVMPYGAFLNSIESCRYIVYYSTQEASKIR